MKTIEIANPRSGGAKRTSARRAEEFIQRGIATWLPDGKVMFVEQARLRFAAAEMRQSLWEEAREFERNRKGVVFWNGEESELAMHRPGEVRS